MWVARNHEAGLDSWKKMIAPVRWTNKLTI